MRRQALQGPRCLEDDQNAMGVAWGAMQRPCQPSTLEASWAVRMPARLCLCTAFCSPRPFCHPGMLADVGGPLKPEPLPG